MAASPRLNPLFLPGLSLAVLVVAGCANPLEDRRVTLCKDIAATQQGAGQAAKVKGSETEIRGREHAAVKVQFTTAAGDGQVVCYYKHEAPEENAITVSDPLSAFATSPYKVTLNGQPLSQPTVTQAVKQAMLKQGKELVDQAKEFGDRAKRAIQEAAR